MQIETDAINYIYEKFEGTTWYIQKICNELYALTEQDNPCSIKDVDVAINYAIEEKDIITNHNGNYYIYDYFLYYWLKKN